MGTLTTTFQNEMKKDLSQPGKIDRVMRARFGMGAAQLETALRAMMAISQGRMPDSAEMKYVVDSGKARFGWSEARTRSEMKNMIDHASPQERLAAYLTANGMTQPNMDEYESALTLVQSALSADLTIGIQDRLDAKQSNNAPRDHFKGMPTTERVAADSRDRAELRDTLRGLVGANRPETYRDKVAEVTKSRLMLADRIDNNAAKHREKETTPSLRETLRDSYDVAVVSAASEDLGLGNPHEAAVEMTSGDNAYLSDDFDVTENISND